MEKCKCGENLQSRYYLQKQALALIRNEQFIQCERCNKYIHVEISQEDLDYALEY